MALQRAVTELLRQPTVQWHRLQCLPPPCQTQPRQSQHLRWRPRPRCVVESRPMRRRTSDHGSTMTHSNSPAAVGDSHTTPSSLRAPWLSVHKTWRQYVAALAFMHTIARVWHQDKRAGSSARHLGSCYDRARGNTSPFSRPGDSSSASSRPSGQSSGRQWRPRGSLVLPNSFQGSDPLPCGRTFPAERDAKPKWSGCVT